MTSTAARCGASSARASRNSSAATPTPTTTIRGLAARAASVIAGHRPRSCRTSSPTARTISGWSRAGAPDLGAAAPIGDVRIADDVGEDAAGVVLADHVLRRELFAPTGREKRNVKRPGGPPRHLPPCLQQQPRNDRSPERGAASAEALLPPAVEYRSALGCRFPAVFTITTDACRGFIGGRRASLSDGP